MLFGWKHPNGSHPSCLQSGLLLTPGPCVARLVSLYFFFFPIICSEIIQIHWVFSYGNQTFEKLGYGMTFLQYSHRMFFSSSFPLLPSFLPPFLPSFCFFFFPPSLPPFLFPPFFCPKFKPSMHCARHYAKGGVKESLICTFTIFLKFIYMPGIVPGPWVLGMLQETKHTLFLLLWGLQCCVSHSGNWMFSLG